MAGLSYQDVGLLNSSMDNVSQTLMRKRMLDQQAAERAEGFGIERERMQATQAEAADRTRMMKQHYADTIAETKRYHEENEKRYNLANTFKKLGEFREGLKDAMSNMAESAAADPAKAKEVQDYFAGVIEQQDEDIKGALKKDPNVRQVLDGKVDWAQLASSLKRQYAQHPTATRQDLEYAQSLEEQAKTAREDGDNETADKMEKDAALIRQRLKKSEPARGQNRTEVTEKDSVLGPERTTKRVVYEGSGNPASGRRIKVISADGKRGSIPEEQWQDAEKMGFKKVQ